MSADARAACTQQMRAAQALVRQSQLALTHAAAQAPTADVARRLNYAAAHLATVNNILAFSIDAWAPAQDPRGRVRIQKKDSSDAADVRHCTQHGPR